MALQCEEKYVLKKLSIFQKCVGFSVELLRSKFDSSLYK